MALVDTFNGADAIAGTTRTLTLTSAYPIGSFIVASVTANGATTTCALTDTRSNTWTQRSTHTYTANTITNWAQACKVTTALQIGDVITITFGASRTNYASVFGVFDDGASTTLDGTAAIALNNTITPITGATGDPATARALVILSGGTRGTALSFVGAGGGTAVGYASSGTLAANRAAFLGYIYVTNPGTQTPSGTLGAIDNWVAEAMAFDAVVNATVTGVAATASLSAPAGAVTGGATVTGVAATSTLGAPAGSVTGGATVDGVVAAATVSAPAGTASGSAAPATGGSPGGRGGGLTIYQPQQQLEQQPEDTGVVGRQGAELALAVLGAI